MRYQEVEGDLIKLAKQGRFDVIVHGCNCFCVMGAGIAPQMAEAFACDTFKLEHRDYLGDINKLGQIDYETDYLQDAEGFTTPKKLTVVNAYTQFNGGCNLDYEALILCMRKINHVFKGMTIGLPQIGCGIAGGVWDENSLSEDDYYAWNRGTRDFKFVKYTIQQELKDCNITIVKYKP